MGSDNIFQLNIEALYINIPFSDLYITHIDYISVEHSISTEVPQRSHNLALSVMGETCQG